MVDIEAYLEDFLSLVEHPPSVKKDWVKVRDSMIIHTRGVTPKKLLEDKRPNEPQDLLDYRLLNYRPITKDGINNAIDSVFRTLIASNFVIDPSDDLEEWFTDKRFTIQDSGEVAEPLAFKEFILEHVLRIMFDDPNAFLVWMPTNINPSLPPKDNPPTEKIDVEPWIVDSPRIIDTQSEVFSFTPKEQWPVRIPLTGNKKDKIEFWPYYFVITTHSIYRLIPFYSREAKEIRYETELWYNTGITEEEVDQTRELTLLPVKILGGNISINHHDQKFFESYFNAYVPFGDEAITSFSDNQAVRVRYNFPFVSVKGEKCPRCKGVKTVQGKDDHGKPRRNKCNTCNGSGSVIPFSPFGQHTSEPPATTESESYALLDPWRFYTPDVEILKQSKETWREFLDDAKEALNMIFTKEAQSGVAKEIDREEKNDQLFKISNNIFDIILTSLVIIEAYRQPFVDKRKVQSVKAPTSFLIKSQDDLMKELTELTKNNAPLPYIATTAIELGKKAYAHDEKAQRIIEVLTVWDTLFGTTDQNIGLLRAAGGIGTIDITRHVEGFKILSMLSDQDLLKTIPEIIEIAEAKLIIEEQVELVDPDGSSISGQQDIAIGKLPLALQQLGLALARAKEAGLVDLAKQIEDKMKALVGQITT